MMTEEEQQKYTARIPSLHPLGYLHFAPVTPEVAEMTKRLFKNNYILTSHATDGVAYFTIRNDDYTYEAHCENGPAVLTTLDKLIRDVYTKLQN